MGSSLKECSTESRNKGEKDYCNYNAKITICKQIPSVFIFFLPFLSPFPFLPCAKLLLDWQAEDEMISGASDPARNWQLSFSLTAAAMSSICHVCFLLTMDAWPSVISSCYDSFIFLMGWLSSQLANWLFNARIFFTRKHMWHLIWVMWSAGT